MDNRSIKVTTKEQFQKFVELIEQNPDIGRGKLMFGSSKNEQKLKWNEFAEELNSLGPPFRTGNEWQRVWIHYKAKTKKKLANNRKNVLATGGGPSEEIPLSPLEESVANLVQMSRQIVPEGQSFGIENVDPNLPKPLAEAMENPEKNTNRETSGKKRITKKPTADEERLELLKQQTKTQKELIEKISRLEKTCYKQYLLSKEKFEFEKRKAGMEEEINRIPMEYQTKKIARLDLEMA